MDLQLLLAVNILAFSGMGLVSLLLRRDWRMASEIAIQAGLLVAGVAALKFGWPQAGTILAGLFSVLVLLPWVLNLIGNRKAAKGDADAGARFAHWAALVHPTPVLRFNARVSAAQALGNPAASAAALRAIIPSFSPRYAPLLEIAALRVEDRWDDILVLTLKPDAAGHDIAVYRIRSLGEAGRLEEMVAAYKMYRNVLPADYRVAAELFVLAFAGRPEAVSIRVDGRNAPYNEETRGYWKAIAERNAGQSDFGVLEALARTTRHGTTQLAAQRHLRQGPIRAAKVLSAESLAAVDDIELRLNRGAAISALPRFHALATLLLIAANSVMFAAELWRGGAEDNATLYELGALWPPAVIDNGEWWRLATALFLHYGWAHFAVNMLALYVLGRAVEARFGTIRMLVIYLLGGIGSSAGVLTLMHYDLIEADILVGASGAIMALFGALVAYQVVTWRQSRDVLDRRPVLAMAGIVALQFACDMSIPQVSLAGHASGMALGFLMALPLAARRMTASGR